MNRRAEGENESKTARTPAGKFHVVDSTLSSTLQDVMRNCWLSEDLGRLNNIGPAPSRHTHAAEPLTPCPPPRPLPRLREPDDNGLGFILRERSWWHRWPPRAPQALEDMPSSVRTGSRSCKPSSFKPPRSCQESRVCGTVASPKTLLKSEVGQEELASQMVQLQTRVLLDLVGNQSSRLGKAVSKGRGYLISTVEYYPLVPPEVGRVDPRYALCAYANATGSCPRGIRCHFVHSMSRVSENFRRIILKVRARVKWAMTFVLPIWPPRFGRPQLPGPSEQGFQWSDDQAKCLPQWITEKPHCDNANQYLADLIHETKMHGRSVKRFEMRKCPLSHAGVLQLCPTLQGCIYLRELCLAYCDITDETIAPIAEFLDSHQTLLSLELGFNNIGAEGTAVLSEAAISCSCLRHLSLHGNPVGDEGVASLSRLLLLHTGLRSLNLASTMVGDDGWMALSRVLSTNKYLTILNLDGTVPSLMGCLHLFHSIKLNTSLVEISLRYIKATTRCYLENLATVMEKNQKVRRRMRQKQFREVGRASRKGGQIGDSVKLRYKRPARETNA